MIISIPRFTGSASIVTTGIGNIRSGEGIPMVTQAICHL